MFGAAWCGVRSGNVSAWVMLYVQLLRCWQHRINDTPILCDSSDSECPLANYFFAWNLVSYSCFMTCPVIITDSMQLCIRLSLTRVVIFISVLMHLSLTRIVILISDLRQSAFCILC